MESNDKEINEEDLNLKYAENQRDLYSQLIYEYDEETMMDFLRDNLEELEEISQVAFDKVSEIEMKEPKYSEYYTLEDSLEIAREFLETIDPKHKKQFDKLLADGTIDIVSEPEKDDEPVVNYKDYEGGIRQDVHIPLQHNLDDVYSLVHEYFHTTNLDNNYTLDRYLLTEAVSIFYEFLLYDYLSTKNVNPDDNKASIYYRLDSLLDDTYDFNYIIGELKPIFKNINFNYKEQPKEELENVFEDLCSDMRYILSTTLAMIKYYEYKQGIISVEQMERFNEHLKETDDLDSLNFITYNDDEFEKIEVSIDYIAQLLKKNKSMKK